jgi:UDP:flavonoid glycosyltransferase YjiC (YdhE family)
VKILIASSSIPGHINPLLAVANILKKHNHEVVFQTAPELKPMVEAAGVAFLPELPETNSFIGYFVEGFPERQSVEPGMAMFSFDVQNLFAKNMPGQARSLAAALREFPADVVLVDSFYWGTLPLLVGPRDRRPTVVHLGITVLNLGSGKNVPAEPCLSEEEWRGDREAVLLQPAQAAANKALADLGCPPLPCPALESMSLLPDLYLHPGIESFEYPDESSTVRYIGSLPLPPRQMPLPEWWDTLDKTKRLVLVTQGTFANTDFGQLLAPTLTALAKEEDVIVLVTTGGQPVESIPVEIPANARVAKFLPFEKMLTQIDVLITNGGYGTVNMALAYGVPVVAAGMTEDKEEVSAHVQWSGAGLDLRTSQPTAASLRKAVRELLDNPDYRNRAKELALEFASHDTEKELITLLEECVANVGVA